MNETKWVWTMDEETQKEIEKDVTEALSYIENEEERKEAIQTAMDSRLVDLEDTIDIKKYI